MVNDFRIFLMKYFPTQNKDLIPIFVGKEMGSQSWYPSSHYQLVWFETINT